MGIIAESTGDQDIESGVGGLSSGGYEVGPRDRAELRTDEDRRPWYARLRARVEAVRATGEPYVLACSALKRDYRAWLRMGDGPELMRFAHLDGSFELIESRLAARKGHFMPPNLLASQFATLELGDDIDPVDIDESVEGIVEDILSRIYTKASA
jgi:carbohydrate kinase (thermoresistant glucokinase family)